MAKLRSLSECCKVLNHAAPVNDKGAKSYIVTTNRLMTRDKDGHLKPAIVYMQHAAGTAKNNPWIMLAIRSSFLLQIQPALKATIYVRNQSTGLPVIQKSAAAHNQEKTSKSGLDLFSSLDEIYSLNFSITILGDFNIPLIDWCTSLPTARDSVAKELVELYEAWNMTQLVPHCIRGSTTLGII